MSNAPKTDFDKMLKNLPPDVAQKMRQAEAQNRELAKLWVETMEVVNDAIIFSLTAAYAGAADDEEREALVDSGAIALALLASCSGVVSTAPATVRSAFARSILSGMQKSNEELKKALRESMPTAVETRAAVRAEKASAGNV